MAPNEENRDKIRQREEEYLASIQAWAARTEDWARARAGLRGSRLIAGTSNDGPKLRLYEQLAELSGLLERGTQGDSLEHLVGGIASTISLIAGDGPYVERPSSDERIRTILEAIRGASPPEQILLQVDALKNHLDKTPPESLWRDVLKVLSGALSSAGNGPAAGADGIYTWDSQARPVSADPVPVNISKTLARLLDQLLLPAALVADAVALQDKLSNELPYDELPAILDCIAELILKSVWEESEDFEQFLRQLTERLSDLQSFVNTSDFDAKKAHDDSTALGRQIRAHVEGLHSSLDKAIDLDQLKSHVSDQLDTIVLRLDDFRHSQQQHRHLWEQQIDHLRVKLKNTEEEANRLRQTLLQQQMRAQLDPLTEIANREAYNERLAYEYARWRRYGTPLSLLIGDVDHFKRVNDRFGHSAGDTVLKGIARLLKDNLREADFIARFGGEEFIILMPETIQENAAKAAEKLRQAVEMRPFSGGGKQLPLTISFGATDFRNHDTPESAFNRADKALYRAKKAGRNTVAAAPL